MKIEDKLALNKFEVDKEPHIKLKEDSCRGCDLRPCLNICPAQCYTLRDNKVHFDYEGCLECGACRIACEKGAVEWSYPRGGFGVVFEYG